MNSEGKQSKNGDTRLQRAFEALQNARHRIERLERDRIDSRMPIAIIGMGLRLPGGVRDAASYWALLRDGVDAVTEVPAERWDVDKFYDPDPDAPGKLYTRQGSFLDDIDRFDPILFGISPREAVRTDPQQRLLLEVAWRALEDAAVAPDRLTNSRTGVFVGLCRNDYARFGLDSGNLEQLGQYDGPGNAPCFASGRISHTLGLTGPSLVIDTACSSSLVALHLACSAIRNGECDQALVGGVQLMLLPDTSVFLCRTKAMSTDGRCRAFDASAGGFGRGEGCVVLVLKPLRAAVRDGDHVEAIVRSSVVNHDGPSSGLTVPSQRAQTALIREALRAADLEPAAIDYVEAHGTGTELGDPIEMSALGDAFGDRSPNHPLRVGSVKTNFGHLEAAAGLAGLVKVVLSMRHSVIPPHLHLRNPSPHITWSTLPLRVPTRAEAWDHCDERPRIAGVSSFGLSGTNAHVLVSEPPQHSMDRDPPRPVRVLTVSARTRPALRELTGRYITWLQQHATPQSDPAGHRLVDFCHTANLGRSHFAYRFAVFGTSAADLIAGLQREANLKDRPVSDNPPVVTFVYPDGLPPESGVRQMYQSEPVFRESIDECLAGLPGFEQFDDDGRRARFASLLNMSCAERRAVIPDVVFQFLVQASLSKLWRSWGIEPDAVAGWGTGLCAAILAAEAVGLQSALQLVLAASAETDNIHDAIGKRDNEIRSVQFRAPQISIIAVDGRPSTNPVEPDFWVSARYRDTSVVGADAIHDIVRPGNRPLVLLTIGIDSAVNPPQSSDLLLPGFGARHDQSDAVANSVAQLYRMGAALDWNGYDRRHRAQRIRIPGYPMQKQRYWLTDTLATESPSPQVDNLPSVAARDVGTAGDAEIRNLAFDLAWQQSPPENGNRIDAGRLLICADSVDSFAEAVSNGIRSSGWDVSRAGFEAAADQFRDDSVAAPRIDAIVWLCGTEDPRPCERILELVRALAEFPRPPRLWIVTRRAQTVIDGDGLPSIPQATLWAMGRVIANEVTNLRCSCIDLEPDDADSAKRLIDSIQSLETPSQLAWRRGRRYVPQLVRHRIPESPAVEDPITIQRDATYVIAGGTGAIGLESARALVDRGARNLLLLARREPVGDAAITIQRMRDADVRVEVRLVDIADRHAMVSVFEEIGQTMPAVRGVVHAAGIVEYEPIASIDPGQMTRVMDAKTSGAWNLHELTLTAPIDLFILHSSAASLLGSRGLAVYAASNGALDALAWFRHVLGLPATCINWGPWASAGMAERLDAGVKRRMADSGISPISPPEARRIMSGLLRDRAVQTMVMHADFDTIAPSPLIAQFVGPRAADPNVASGASRDRTPVREALSLAGLSPTRLRTEIRRELHQELREVLELPGELEIEQRQGFFELGMDSLTAIELRNRLQQRLGCRLRGSTAFDYATTETMVEHLAGLLNGADSGPTETDRVSGDPHGVPQQSGESSAIVQRSADAEEVSSADDVALLLAEELADLEKENCE